MKNIDRWMMGVVVAFVLTCVSGCGWFTSKPQPADATAATSPAAQKMVDDVTKLTTKVASVETTMAEVKKSVDGLPKAMALELTPLFTAATKASQDSHTEILKALNANRGAIPGTTTGATSTVTSPLSIEDAVRSALQADREAIEAARMAKEESKAKAKKEREERIQEMREAFEGVNKDKQKETSSHNLQEDFDSRTVGVMGQIKTKIENNEGISRERVQFKWGPPPSNLVLPTHEHYFSRDPKDRVLYSIQRGKPGLAIPVYIRDPARRLVASSTGQYPHSWPAPVAYHK